MNKTFTYKHRTYNMPAEIIDFYSILTDDVFNRFTEAEKAKAWSGLDAMMEYYFPQFNTYKSRKALLNALHNLVIETKMN